MLALMAEMVAGFTLSRPLGRGGMGQVFEARRADHPGPVAVKLLPPGGEPRTTQRLLREGELLTRLEHPNVIRVHEVGVSQGHPYVAMELLHGVPLSTLVHQLAATASRPSLALVAELARGMARGLHAAHEAGVLHRDIKPSNVVITATGRVVVLDFGIALEGGDVSRLTADGEVAGTPAYLAPEQALGEPLDARADVYQFGLILFELCTLKRPYAELKAFEALTRRLRDGVPSLRQTAPLVEPRLAALTDLCLLKDKDKRLESFAAVLAKLEGLPAGQDELARAVSKISPKSEPAVLEPQASSLKPQASTQIGQWSVLGKLGAGGMGVVFKARTEAGHECALKLMHPNMLARQDVVARFEREIRLQKTLDHPGLVRILDADISGEFPWYAMELVQGESLAERLQRVKKVDAAEGLRILKALISALAALHRAGLIHRDIKPGNVMLETSGRVLLMDLGLVAGEDLTKLTRTGAVVGTPVYLPPEALDGEFGMAGDLYQIGLVLHEMLTGDERLDVQAGPDGVQVPAAVAAHPVLAQVYRAVLASDPAKRPRDASVLEAQFTQAPAPAPAPVKKAPAPRLPQRQAAPTTQSPPTAQTGWMVLRKSSELAVGALKYGLVAITIAISLGILAVLPSIFRRFGS